jgi:O-6-methylguanine DNA methyltransferase
MAEYFAGRRATFDLTLIPQGTAFEASVWTWLRTIPPGETRTYAQGAAAVGRPAAVRAIGRANGRNPLAIVVPCHRVIGSDGDLTGYGGGLWRKQALLDLEAAHA